MATYEYVDKAGNLKKIQASSPQEAMQRAPDIAKNSGVSLVQGGGQTGAANQNVATNDNSALQFLGFSQAQIASMSPGDRQQWMMMGDYLKQQTDLGTVAGENNALSLQQAYQAALKDPNLSAKYGDLDKSSAELFNNNLAALQTYTDVNQANQAIEFNQQQKDQADQYAAAGAAYSGFRQKAKENLATQQQGIITSSIQKLKQDLQGQLSPLEQLYGTKGLNKLIGNQSVSYLNPLTGQRQDVGYDKVGGLKGSLPAQKESDYAARQAQIYGNIASP